MPRRRLYGRRAPMIGGTRRETTWFSIAITNQAVNNTAVFALQLNAAALAKRPFTVVRFHLGVQIRSDQSATEQQLGAIGGCVVSDQASAIGITAVPTPLTDIGSDLWFFHQTMFAAVQAATQVGFQSPFGRYYQIDSKAMRKVNDGSDLIVTLEGDASGGFICDIAGRFLVKEN